MFLTFFLLLRQHGIPVTLSEYLTLLDALRSAIGVTSVTDFYALSKATLVKHEQHLDLFDRVFGEWYNGVEQQLREELPEIPPDWLKEALNRQLTDDEQAALTGMGGLDELWEKLRALLLEQDERHEGGNKWIGTGGTSPFGIQGQAQEGFRMDKTGKRNGNAVKIWEQRAYRNYADDVELSTRNMKMALRRLRILTREGIDNELDIDRTITETSRQGGLLDIQLRPSRKNQVKVLMLFDVGGSMDGHIELCNQLFSAARYQFKHLEFLYFHNCIYESLWQNNQSERGDGRRDRVPTRDVLNTYNREYKVIIVGDASMASYEITHARGSVEHYNEEAGIVWLDRFKAQYPHLVWLNPEIAGYWKYTHSIQLLREWCGNRMFPLTLNGIEQAMRCLKNPKITFDGN
ncbi:vWA domain-containing protein [Arsenicibacter rosenii]|uniref:VWA domain-containing protein n=1 Tax=Arsenicibacter rosenii TaxID=1750698 RepID=A0A1S2VF53_9BACT|nr:VWA domain-containing protein [Arsenicibacter rosenii]OIN57339.1 VWA domain-containing protein [Arsenicibacter rosenii]